MIERAKKEDITQILNISKSFFDWTKTQIEDSLKEENTIFLVEKQKDVLGFLIAEDLVDSINILLIATKKENQKKGIGSALLKELEKIAKQKNIQKIWLEVKETNISAIKFYESQNFKLLTRRKKYYKTGEDAIIYEKNAF